MYQLFIIFINLIWFIPAMYMMYKFMENHTYYNVSCTKSSIRNSRSYTKAHKHDCTSLVVISHEPQMPLHRFEIHGTELDGMIARMPTIQELDEAARFLMKHYDETKNPIDDLHDASVILARGYLLHRKYNIPLID